MTSLSIAEQLAFISAPLVAAPVIFAGLERPDLLVKAGAAIVRPFRSVIKPLIRLAQQPVVKKIKLKAIKVDLALLGADLGIKGLSRAFNADLPDLAQLGGLTREVVVVPFVRQLRREFQAGGIRRASLILAGTSLTGLVILGGPALLAAAAGPAVGIPLLGLSLAVAFGKPRKQDLRLF